MSRRRSRTRGWRHRKPGRHQRTLQLARCGHDRCFLGPGATFPICNPGTCTRNKKGIFSAYVRAQQFHHRTVSKKARNLLRRMGAYSRKRRHHR